MLLISACRGSDQAVTQEQVESVDQQAVEPEQPEAESGDQQQRQPAEQDDRARQADQAVAETTEQGEQAARESEQQESSQPDPQETQQQSEAVSDGPFHPDAVEMSELIYWGPADGFFGRYVPIPGYGQALLDQLLASDSPSVDKYVIDLAAFPSPYWEQALEYLKARFGEALRTVYDFPEIFDFHPDDSATPAYLRFKQALFAGQFEDMAEMMDPEAAIAIDAREIQWGGVRVDGIPPLEFPTQVLPEDAAQWINDTDVVVGVEIDGDARAYPIRIIAWHEMVNDTIGGVPVSLAYCTLCGSPILFDGRVGSEVYRFGTSGLLYRSNKLMYDRNTRTLWNQFSGKPAWGPLVGEEIRLNVLPVVVTTWGDWYSRNPDTTLLSINTGFVRDYGPGVAYRDYFNSPLTWFNVPVSDDRLAQKDNVYAVRIGEALTAYPIALLAERAFAQDEVGGLPIVVVATANGEGGRSYESGDVQFQSADPASDTLIDSEGAVWRIREDSLLGPDGEVLQRVGGHNAYWFAITNQVDNGQLWEG
ncbi:MAG: DUF3179 domain-containing (seleno)protein [Chloroflexi bacterium]|nr:DUF3179 domain-containing (seleno)protein [Chloroflexota bacterium]MCY3589173.1 DUF3179 domain-containing (seleno)protein [Chloroflexota bacterium]MDE2709581.1 DUF3179 domain-containing (seleno)protein [Chloroflexota bacterium]